LANQRAREQAIQTGIALVVSYNVVAAKRMCILLLRATTSKTPEISMSTKQLIDEALKFSPDEHLTLIDKLLQSIDCSDSDLDHLWIEEAERRLAAHRSGQVQGLPAEVVLGSADADEIFARNT